MSMDRLALMVLLVQYELDFDSFCNRTWNVVRIQGKHMWNIATGKELDELYNKENLKPKVEK